MGGTAARWFFKSIYYLLPNLGNLSFITPAAHGQMPEAVQAGAAIAYALIYISVILAAATLIFRRRNFK
jgi:hypothetical protein